MTRTPTQPTQLVEFAYNPDIDRAIDAQLAKHLEGLVSKVIRRAAMRLGRQVAREINERRDSQE